MLLELRKYQKDAVDKIGRHNAIIKMPTGSGKTFVASEFIRRGLTDASKKFDDDATAITAVTTGSGSVQSKSSNSVCELAALFLVPTCDLAVQQSQAIQAWIGDTYTVSDYHGRKAAPNKRFDVLVSTPQAFLTLQQNEESKKLFDWSNFFCCVFDEVCLSHGYLMFREDCLNISYHPVRSTMY
jgi:superfamily II DNA or RNA helicase